MIDDCNRLSSWNMFLGFFLSWHSHKMTDITRYIAEHQYHTRSLRKCFTSMRITWRSNESVRVIEWDSDKIVIGNVVWGLSTKIISQFLDCSVSYIYNVVNHMKISPEQLRHSIRTFGCRMGRKGRWKENIRNFPSKSLPSTPVPSHSCSIFMTQNTEIFEYLQVFIFWQFEMILSG